MHYFAALLIFLVAGCFKSPEVQSVNRAQWEAKGRIGLLSTDSTNNVNANFFYSAADDVERLELWGPAGMGHVIITNATGFAAITDGQGRLHRGDNIDTLVEDIVGWPIPASSFRHWFIGNPNNAQDAQNIIVNDDGLMDSFDQDGWHVRYRQWKQHESESLPFKIRAVHAERAIRINVIISQWND